ncbi:MAG: apolipoprotein N-acyltransferase [Proteobacteria bacterium]|nr:apolipoprotein N-acyltransferase [Pseudomonadota bacterium]
MPSLSRLPVGPGPLAAAVLSGLLLSLAFPRPEIWPLALPALAPVLLAARGREPKVAFGLGFLAGLVHAGTLVYWLINVLVFFGGLPVWLAVPVFLLLVGYMALYPALFILGMTRLENRLGWLAGGTTWICAGAALYTGLEHFKGFFLTGFPWEPLGAALVPALPLIQVSDIVGTGGLTFLVVLVNMALTGLVIGLRERNRRVWIAAACWAAAPLLLAWGYGVYRLPEVRAELNRAASHRVAIVQGSIEQKMKWDPSHRVFTMATYRDLTMRAAAEKPWLVVWPETAAPFFFLKDEAATDWLKRMVARSGRPLLFGAPAYEEKGDRTTYFNRAYLVDAQGRPLGWYAKSHLVPYGEYVPLKEWFPFLGKVTEAAGDYSPGPRGKLLDLDGEKIGVLICYESVFPELAREQAANGAGYLVIMTNDAWFGRSSAPYQHYAQAVLRAVENRRTVIRAANTGISGLIEPDGRTQCRLGLFERGYLSGRAPRPTGQTFYTAVGDVVPWTCLGIAVMLLAAPFIRRQEHVG